MIELVGEGLSKRQQELNRKVQEVVQKQISFDDVKALEEKSDVDKLYKIDLASHYKNVDYIVDVLKGGDSLYICRALKCDWLYSDEYSHIINPDYLHHELFPYMSLKMKSKLLNCIASHIRNESRAASFFDYCQGLRMTSFSVKFLLFTSETHKMNVIESNYELIRGNIDNCGNLQYFIGESFKLANAYINRFDYYAIDNILNKLSYLYSVDEEKFLDLFEGKGQLKSSNRFGGRMSKSIMMKHKSRVLERPYLYVHKLNKYMTARHCNQNDVKKLISSVFPEDIEKFWCIDFYHEYKYLFDKIPSSEVFDFFKNTFITKYGNESFEMNVQFYHHKYYEIFTVEEREQWALKHIEEAKELFGSNKDYVWYSFVNFEKAFKAVKSYVFLTTDEDERNEIVRTLINSCRNQKDLENLFNYFYERHVNECGHHKENFMDKVIELKNVFEFDDACWNAFNKILYSMEVYTPGFYGKTRFRALCVIYNILHGKDMAEALTHYLDCDVNFWEFKSYYKLLKKEEWQKVYQYLYEYYFANFQTVNKDDVEETKREKIRTIQNFLDLLNCYEVPKENLPELVLTFIQENIDEFPSFKVKKKLSEAELLRLLKKDKQLLLDEIPNLKTNMGRYSDPLRNLIKKIRTYFYNDLAHEFLELFKSSINQAFESKNFNISSTAVYGIIQLSDINFKLEFIRKYTPKDGKIDHMNIDTNLLDTQRAICQFVGYSRPPLPLEIIVPYIKGDYVQYCLSLFGMYLAHLPLPLCNKFIEFILNAPVSVQKHGIRLAFRVYSVDNLKPLIFNIWNKTKNVSLRGVIYKALIKKIRDSNDSIQNEFFESLKKLTATLNEDDHDEVFDLLTSPDVPERFRASILESAWEAVRALPHKKSRNISLKTRIVKTIENCFTMDRDYCRSQLINEHVQHILHNKGIINKFKPEEDDLHNALWDLTTKYIRTCDNETELQKSLQLLEIILQETFKNWNLVVDQNNYVVIKFFYGFVDKLKRTADGYEYKYLNTAAVFKKVLECIKDHSPAPYYQTFVLTLDLKLGIIMREVAYNDFKDKKELAQAVSKSLLSFVQEIKTKKEILPSFFYRISNLITSNIQDLSYLRRHNSDLVKAYICNELVLTDCTEAIIFAISIMPIESNGFPPDEIKLFNELSSVFKEKLKAINNFEIQSYYYNKFILGGEMSLDFM